MEVQQPRNNCCPAKCDGCKDCPPGLKEKINRDSRLRLSTKNRAEKPTLASFLSIAILTFPFQAAFHANAWPRPAPRSATIAKTVLPVATPAAARNAPRMAAAVTAVNSLAARPLAKDAKTVRQDATRASAKWTSARKSAKSAKTVPRAKMAVTRASARNVRKRDANVAAARKRLVAKVKKRTWS